MTVVGTVIGTAADEHLVREWELNKHLLKAYAYDIHESHGDTENLARNFLFLYLHHQLCTYIFIRKPRMPCVS